MNVYKNKSNKNLIRTIVVLGVFLFIGVIFYTGFVVGKISDGKIDLAISPEVYASTDLPDVFQGSLIKQVWSIVQSDYVDKENINPQELYYGAIKGFVSGLEDPYTVFFDPEMAKSFDEQINGEFEGIGAEVTIKDGVLTIVAPIDGTPAAQAGLKSGDKVYAVNGVETTGLGVDEAVEMIRGERGTKVTLLIVRDGEDAQEIEITRDVIEIKSVKWEFLDNNILYIDFQAFNSDTVSLFNKIVKEVNEKQPNGIIIDVRNNPGGLLDVAIDVASLWVNEKPVVLEKYSDGTEIVHSAKAYTPFANYPTVILQNEGSASGSEILSGALKDYDIAQIVGQKSFGKGSVQALKKLPDGSAVKVTIAKWLTPNGTSIDKEGIPADFEVEYTIEDFENNIDPQLDKAKQLLTE